MISNIPTVAMDQHRQRSQADMLEAALGQPLTKEQIAAAREPTEYEVQTRIHELCMRINKEADAASIKPLVVDPYKMLGAKLYGVDAARPGSDRTVFIAGGRRNGKSYLYDLWKQYAEGANASNQQGLEDIVFKSTDEVKVVEAYQGRFYYTTQDAPQTIQWIIDDRGKS